MDLQSTTIVILSLYKIVVEAKANPSLKMKFLKIWFKKMRFSTQIIQKSREIRQFLSNFNNLIAYSRKYGFNN